MYRNLNFVTDYYMKKLILFGAVVVLAFGTLAGFANPNHNVKFFHGNFPGINAEERQALAFKTKDELKTFTGSMIKQYKVDNKENLKNMNLAKKLEARREFKQFFNRYDDKFFKTQDLIIAIVDQAPKCCEFSIRTMDVKNDTLVIRLNKKCPNPTDKKHNWVMVLETNKSNFPNYSDVKVVV